MGSDRGSGCRRCIRVGGDVTGEYVQWMCIVLVEVGEIGDVERSGGGDCESKAVPRRDVSKKALGDGNEDKIKRNEWD